MITGDADGVPFRHFGCAVGESVGNQPHRGLRRKDVSPAGDVFFQNVILDCPPELLAGHPLIFSHRYVHGQEHGGG